MPKKVFTISDGRVKLNGAVTLTSGFFAGLPGTLTGALADGRVKVRIELRPRPNYIAIWATPGQVRAARRKVKSCQRL